MPLIFKPGQRMTLTLATDKGDPNPRKFHFSAPSGLEAIELADLNDSIKRDSKTIGGAEAAQRVFNAVGKFLQGWENCPVPYEAGKSIGAVATLAETLAYIVGPLMTGGLGDEEKGN